MKLVSFIIPLLHLLYTADSCPEKCSCDSKTESYLVKCFSAGLTELPTDMSNNITILLMPFNRIRRIRNQTFSKYTSLEHIVISHNRIDRVDPGAFSGLNNLVRLVLSGNLISHFPWFCLSDLPAISVLSLEENRITNLPDKQELGRLKRLKSFRIHGNKLRCSCQFFEFADWIQENEKKSTRYDVTILRPEQINCQSRLGWLNISVMEISGIGKRLNCPLPKLLMKITTSPNGSSVNYVRQAPLSSSDVTEKSQDPIKLGQGLAISLHANRTQIKNRTLLPTISDRFAVSKDFNYTLEYLAVLRDTGNSNEEVLHIYAREYSPLKISCSIKNYNEIPLTSEIFLRTSAFLTGNKYVDIEHLENWTNSNEIVIAKLEWVFHNAMRVTCASENIAGTVTRQVIIHVVREQRKSKSEIGEINITVPSKNTGQENRTREDAHTKDSETVNGNSAPEDVEYASLCLDNPISPLIRLKGTNSTRGLKYGYSYDKRINVTMEEDYRERGIVVTIKADHPGMGMIYICHSHADRVVRKWENLRETEKRIVIRSASAVRPFIVCVMSTYYQREVCGNFTASGRVTRSIIVMAVVGVFLISMAVVPMFLAAMHHVYTNRHPRFPNIRREMRIRELPPPMSDYWSTDYSRKKSAEHEREMKVSRTTPTMRNIVAGPQVRSMECLSLPQEDYNLEDRQCLLGNSPGASPSDRTCERNSNAYLNAEDPVVQWLQNVDTEEYQYDEGVGHLL